MFKTSQNVNNESNFTENNVLDTYLYRSCFCLYSDCWRILLTLQHSFDLTADRSNGPPEIFSPNINIRVNIFTLQK